MGGIVWLASYPKSGNTWVRGFLHNLLRPQSGSHDINDMQGLTAYENAARWFRPLLARPLAECTTAEVAAVRPRAQEALAAEAAGLVFAKTHNALVIEYGQPAINTRVTAGAIYIVRNPLDVATSFANHLSTDTDRAIELMNTEGLTVPNTDETCYEVYGSWRQHVDTWTLKPHAGKYVVRYEDLLERPDSAFGGLCEFLQLAPTRPALATAIEKSAFGRLREQEERRGFQEKPEAAQRFFREGKAGGWRKDLTADQVRRIIAPNRETMARFGYLPEDF